MHYGFIGLGNLGSKLAARLAENGFAVTGFDTNTGFRESLEHAGVKFARSPQELAAAVDHVITCLPSPDASSAVLDQILGVMGPEASVIEMSTIGRDDAIRFAAVAERAGVGFLELPVTGGVHLAAVGELTLLAGGPASLMAVHQPALNVMGNEVIHMGPVGSASLIKVITNMLALVHLQVCGEALMLASRGGLDLATSWQAIAASSGNSFVHETEGQLILNGSYDIGFTIDLALKDLGFAQQFAAELGVPLELAAATFARFQDARDAYGGESQSPKIVKLLEDALDTPLRAPGFPAALS
jgi:3-hydroxyisobutyrate dehydrogenase